MYKLTSEMQLKPVDTTVDDVTQFTDGAIVIDVNGKLYKTTATTYELLLDPADVVDMAVLSDYLTIAQAANDYATKANYISNKNEISGLDSRVTTLENTYITEATADSRYALISDLNTVQSLSTTNYNAIISLSNTVSTNQTNISTNATGIQNLITLYANLNSDVTTIEGMYRSKATEFIYTDGHITSGSYVIQAGHYIGHVIMPWYTGSDGTLFKGPEFDTIYATISGVNAWNASVNPKSHYIDNAGIVSAVNGGTKKAFRAVVRNADAVSHRIKRQDNGSSDPYFMSWANTNESTRYLTEIIIAPYQTIEIELIYKSITVEGVGLSLWPVFMYRIL